MIKSRSNEEVSQPLPKLPVPPLAQTLERYVAFLEPIVSGAQYERSSALARTFGLPGGLGQSLQKELEQKREIEKNWAYEYWINDMYLLNRLPLPINSNPGMVLPPRKFTTVVQVARFASKLIDGAVDYKEMLRRGDLEQERCTSNEKGQPLCMAQYYRLLGSCRIPGIDIDSQFFPESEYTDAHIIVMCRNQMYSLAVEAADRGRLSEDEICAQLLFILNDAPCLLEPSPPIGLLSSQERTQWARDRETLIKIDYKNRHNLELIERSLCIICLDESFPIAFNYNQAEHHSTHNTNSGRDETNMAHQMLHGGGSNLNSGNRWFDKPIQLVICNDGAWGLCYEHSPSEGIAVIQLIEKLMNHADSSKDENSTVSHSHIPPPQRLEWVVDATLDQSLKRAAFDINCAIEDLDFFVYRFRDYGKEFIKSCKVSPDAYIQLSLQLAYYKLYGHLVSTYESASTVVSPGRVDCIRSASMAALRWAAAMCQGEAPDATSTMQRNNSEDSVTGKRVQERRELFHAAVAVQTKTMLDNILGQGIDVHLLGLREAARARNPVLPEIFTDESYKVANTFTLSTSQVACKSDSFMGYGPVTPAGYGASYNPRPNEIVFCLSAFQSAEHTSTANLSRALSEALTEMRELLTDA
ncbi:choline O-acetyltransferase isoform X2 [Ctenocephalides felis]|uniref:choline O-acetyltransferase isoform X2 n=1 Tax=Ctenocephalides felis TaxID=7515 RepID=UPI000E6E1A47|nr:choline O-acetyltransferase isoform X2 [Ctenocephalides felis]